MSRLEFVDADGNGFLDFAGSAVVHMIGGFSGLTGAIILGPRIGRFDPVTREPRDMPERNVTLMILGVGVLWFGWYGFNCGSVYGLSGDGNLVGKIAVNTTIAAASGGIVSIFMSQIVQKVYNVSMLLNGILAGLVSITASADIVDPWMAMVIGFVGALWYLAAA